MAFVHLHNHTEYSLLDGATKVAEMAEYAYSLGMEAIAITDHGYMYGVPEFVKACNNVTKKAVKKWKEECVAAEEEGRELPPKPRGIKPIIGCEVYFTPDSTLARDRKPELYHMILLAKNDTGYHNLLEIVSEAAVEGFYYKPRVTVESLEKRHEGIIATSACLAGIIPRRLELGMVEEAMEWAERFASIFGKDDFYIELQDHGISTDDGLSQRDLNEMLVDLAAKAGLKTVATNDIHYLRQEDYRTQDMLMCIGMGKELADEDRMRFKSEEYYLKTEEQMRELFKDHPEACDNTVEIAEKCNVELSHEMIFPRLPVPDGETNESMLRKNVMAGLVKRYGEPLSQEVIDRFEYEYEIICSKGFAAYFLIVQEFIQWAKDNGIGVGPGRGSAAGSIVSYALNITTFDPLENGLLFERFLSPEREEMPDIDTDFDDERRLEVVQHVKEVYGEDHIANVITFNKLKARQAMQDAARVLGYPQGKALEINKLFRSPFANIAGTMGQSKKQSDNDDYYSPDFVTLYNSDEDARRIIDAARELEGSIRGEGVHACAVVICRDSIAEHVPSKLDTKGGTIISQYDGVNIADLGLLKMDFLGLRTLTVISDALANIERNHGVRIDLDSIDFTDPAIYDLFARGDTKGVFQIESAGLTSLLQRMKPDRYSDIIAAIALYRPGPLEAGMVDDFVDRKQGVKQIKYYDNRLKDILEETYGTIVYQEQVMQISVRMSGFSAGESDKVRKAVAKKKIDLMTKTITKWSDGQEETMKDHWINGAERNGYDRVVAQKIWDDVEKFASYAFNKSHSAAYAILTMQTAWLKAHYPLEYMAAVLTSYMGKSPDKLRAYIADLTSQGVRVLPPDVNSSMRDFTAVGDAIRFGLAGIKGMGLSAADEIIAERETNGDFSSLQDFVNRVSTKTCNKKGVEVLIKSGAFDSTGYTRMQLMRFLIDDGILESASKRQHDREIGQVSMFDMLGDDNESVFEEEIPLPDGVEWERREKLNFEHDVLGMYISDHPLSPYQSLLNDISEFSLSVFAQDQDEADEVGSVDGEMVSETTEGVPTDRPITLAGMVSNFTNKVTKKGERMATFTLESMDGSIECVVFPKVFEECQMTLREENIVKVKGRYDRTDRGSQIRVTSVSQLPFGRTIRMDVDKSRVDKGLLEEIRRTAVQFPGPDRMKIVVHSEGDSPMSIELPLDVETGNKVLQSTLNTLMRKVHGRMYA